MIARKLFLALLPLVVLIATASASFAQNPLTITLPDGPLQKGWTFEYSDGDLNGDGLINDSDCLFQVACLLTFLAEPWCDDRAPEGFRTCLMFALDQNGLLQGQFGNPTMMPTGPDGKKWCYGEVYGLTCFYCPEEEVQQPQSDKCRNISNNDDDDDEDGN